MKTKLDFEQQSILIWHNKEIASNYYTKDSNVELLSKIDLGDFKTTWTKEKQSSFIKSLLLKLPTILKTTKHGAKDSIIILNGKNRVFAIKQFLNNDLELCDLNFLVELNGLKYSDLCSSVKRNFIEHSIRTEHYSLSAVQYVMKTLS